MKILVLNGPNLNMLGIREPAIYGKETYADLTHKIKAYADKNGITIDILQSNHEGELVDAVQQAYGCYDGIVMNPAAYTHTSIAIADALKAVAIPTVEIHISDIRAREEFRQISYIKPVCIATVVGEGTDGYLHAIDILRQHWKGEQNG